MRLLEDFERAEKAYIRANDKYVEAQNDLLNIKERFAIREAELLDAHTCKNPAERSTLCRMQMPELYKEKADKESELNRRSTARRNAELAWDLQRYKLRLFEQGKSPVLSVVDSDETQAALS